MADAAAAGDAAPDIVRKKYRPNRLIVEDSLSDENSVVTLSQAKMDELDLYRGDTLMIKGKRGRDTVRKKLTECVFFEFFFLFFGACAYLRSVLPYSDIM